MRRLAKLLLVLAPATIGACSSPDGTSPRGGDLRFGAAVLPELEGIDTTRWVSIYDPEKAWNGYTLGFYKRRIPILFDMNGRVVHAWPEARAKSRLRLLPDGSLLAISLGREIVEYDWDGNLVWEYPMEAEFPHHDVIRLESGNTMLLTLSPNRKTENVVEVDREGQVVWEWQSHVELREYLERQDRGRLNPSHINSVQVLPENPWFDAGDERFAPGNVLISVRNLNTVFLIEKATKKVVWTYDHELDQQHEALMNPPDFPGPGNIFLFNNGYGRRYKYRKSEILEIDPRSSSIVWQYEADGFYSPTSGLEQPLPNGNVLISSSRGGRAFEITREGEVVWEWTPPYEPTRPNRYAPDHCPQLAALPKPAPVPVLPEPGYLFVDRDVYRFARRGASRPATVAGEKTRVLRTNNFCRELMLPAEGQVQLAYGVDREALEATGRGDWQARFSVHVRDRDGGEEVELHRDVVGVTGPIWRRRTLEVDEHSRRWVEMCVATEAVGAAAGEPTEPWAYWISPAITARRDFDEEDEADSSLTPEELQVREQHLKAMGYVD